MTSTTRGPVRRNTRATAAQVRALMDAAIGYYDGTSPDDATTHFSPDDTHPAQTVEDDSRPDSQLRRAEAAKSDPERAAELNAFRPKIAYEVLRDIREAVVGQILLVPYVSQSSDQTMCSILYVYAEHIHGLRGSFNPDLHLSDRHINHYLEDRRTELKASSKATLRSTLKRIREGTPDKPRAKPIPRTKAQLPYTQDEWSTLRRKVRELLDKRLQTDLTMLLDLTGEAGLRSSEAVRATGAWIASVDGTTVIRVPDCNGEFRDVPVFGIVGERLYQHRDSKQWLLAPTLTSRKNVMTYLKAKAEPHSGLQDINPVRARNHWLADLVTRRVPSTVVWKVAGVRPGSHTVGDILRYVQEPDSRDTVRHLAHVRNH